MAHHRSEPWWAALGLERLAGLKVSHREPREAGQRAKGTRKSMTGKALRRCPRLLKKVRNAASADGDQCVKRACITKLFIVATKQPRGEAEKKCSALGYPGRIDLLLEQGRPAILEVRKFGAAYSPREQAIRSGPQSGFGGRHGFIELFQPFPPPGELRRSEHRLRRTRDSVAHRRVDVEQRFEVGPDIFRNLPQNLHPVGADSRNQLFVSDSRRPLRQRRRPRP